MSAVWPHGAVYRLKCGRVALLFGPNDASATAAAAIATVADAGSVDTDVLGSGPRRAASQAPA